MKNYAKRIALAGALAVAVAMLASCQVGSNYTNEGQLKGDVQQIPQTRKDQIVSVPYTGGTPVEVVQTDDPYEAKLVDENGYLTESGKKWDKNGNGLDDDFPDAEGAGEETEGDQTESEEGAEE